MTISLQTPAISDLFDLFDITISIVTKLDDAGDCQFCDAEGAEVEGQVYFTRHGEAHAGRRFFDGCTACISKVLTRDADTEFPITIEVTA